MSGAASRQATVTARLAAIVEEALSSALPALDSKGAEGFGVDRLVESMRYSLRTPGKRIRPLLLLAVAESLGTPASKLARFAAGLEMIHAYSLIHDDLPAMDDDDLRRGMPTNHVVYGDGMAILAGDALLTEAFVVMLEPVAEARLQARAIQEIARAAGREGMVGGQAADLMADAIHGGRLHNEGAVASVVRAAAPAREVELLQAIHARKTGALLRVAARAGALLAGAGESDLACLTEFGTRFGLAFQIADDIKDETAPTAVTGKREGGDRLSGKLTYPALFGIDGSHALLQDELAAAVESLAAFSRDATSIIQVATDAVATATDLAGA
ncbi:MAG TPA: farnesyl diphosphate synthase [Candidatus Limnocylindrales bacterium]|nr:farnesyl diphosphate synthase [Candidatus Limnocylindrales bacterium]